MKIQFTGEAPHLPEPDPRRDRSAGVPSIPDHVLDRHRARVLRPGDVPLAPGAATPGGTIYRYQRLLMCHRLLDNHEQLSELDAALAVQGYQIDRGRIPGGKRAKRMHRAAVRLGERATPGTVDAWRVLQTVRSAVDGGRCGKNLLGGLRLEHLLVGARGGGGPSTGNPDQDGPLGSPSYPRRIPVELVMPMPTRTPLNHLPGGRRPVIAVLDTGIAHSHPAFEVSERQDSLDSFVTVDSSLQKLIAEDSDPEAPLLDRPWDTEVTAGDSLIGEVASHFGHGTFIAGIIRQLAPDAEVRAIRIMHNDGLVYENECMNALTILADEVERARGGDETARPVDVVSLSFGFVDEDPYDQASGGLMRVIKRLAGLGVPVVAGAGNNATNRPFYPAALATEKLHPESAPIISVGALNPNGSVAMFSNDGPWISCFATGASMVSTFPTYASGARNPHHGNSLGGRYRESFDPDDFSSGFAVWNGTSFAAPVVAAKLADAMIGDSPFQLSVQDPAATVQRVSASIKAIGG